MVNPEWTIAIRMKLKRLIHGNLNIGSFYGSDSIIGSHLIDLRVVTIYTVHNL